MMAIKPDMGMVAERLNMALQGAPHVGCHTFGEQGQFPHGTSEHGNLMFSVLVFSNRRVVVRVVNMDTGKTIEYNEYQPLCSRKGRNSYKGLLVRNLQFL